MGIPRIKVTLWCLPAKLKTHTCLNSPSYGHVSVEQVSCPYYNGVSLYFNLNDTVIKTPETTTYRLKGINMMTADCPRLFHAPNDVDIARVSEKQENPEYDPRLFTCFYVAFIKRQTIEMRGQNIGFVVHAHCWVFLNRVLGKTNPNTFIRAARKYWLRHDGEYRFMGEGDLTFDDFWGRPEVYRSPLIVPEIQDAVKRNTHRKAESARPPLLDIPLEIMILIVDWTLPVDYTTSAVRETQRMLLAFRWILPDTFWKNKNLECVVLTELEPLKDATGVNWQSLILELMGILSDRTWYQSSGLANRARVLGIIDAIKPDLA